MKTIEALVRDHLGNSKSGRNQSWSLTGMSSRKRTRGKTIRGGRLREFQKHSSNGFLSTIRDNSGWSLTGNGKQKFKKWSRPFVEAGQLIEYFSVKAEVMGSNLVGVPIFFLVNLRLLKLLLPLRQSYLHLNLYFRSFHFMNRLITSFVMTHTNESDVNFISNMFIYLFVQVFIIFFVVIGVL